MKPKDNAAPLERRVRQQYDKWTSDMIAQFINDRKSGMTFAKLGKKYATSTAMARMNFQRFERKKRFEDYSAMQQGYYAA